MTVLRGGRRGALQQVKPSQEIPRQSVGRIEAGGFWWAVLEAIKLVVIIGLGVALGELLVRFVWSYLIWQWLQQHLP